MTAPGGFTAGDVLTAADMNALPGGIIGSDANTTNVSLTTSPTEVTAITVDVYAGRAYAVYFTCRNMSVGQSNTIIDFDLNITGGSQLTNYRKFLATTTSRESLTMMFLFTPASDDLGGEYTVDVSTDTGTGTLFGSAYDLQMWIVDVGQAP